jgi:hypothetical protein
MMPRRLALFGLVVSTIAIVTAYALAFLPGGANDVSVLLMIFGIAAMAVSLMILGAVRSGEKLGVLAFAFSFVFLVLMVGFAVVLLMPGGDSATTRLFGGLPPRAAMVIYGIGLLPVLVLPLVYARTFEERTLTEEDLRKVKEAAEAHARTSSAGSKS